MRFWTTCQKNRIFQKVLWSKNYERQEKTYSADFKAKVVLELLSDASTLNHVAKRDSGAKFFGREAIWIAIFLAYFFVITILCGLKIP